MIILKRGIKMKTNKIENFTTKISKRWKDKNENYLKQLECFLDTVDNVKDEDLKIKIIFKMLRCDEILTNIAEEEFKNRV